MLRSFSPKRVSLFRSARGLPPPKRRKSSPRDSTGSIEIQGSARFNSPGTLEIELGGTATGEFDVLTISGAGNLGGKIQVALIEDYTPTLGDTFDILTAGSVVGTFATEDLPTLSGLMEFDLEYGPGVVTLSVAPELDGDFNLDGDVNGADFLTWQRNPNVGNLSDWQGNYGASLQLTAASTAVPEPSTLLLLAAGLPFLRLRHNRTAA